MVQLHTFAPLLLLLGILPALGNVIVKGDGVKFIKTGEKAETTDRLEFNLNAQDRTVEGGIIDVVEFEVTTFDKGSDGPTKKTEKLKPKCKFVGSVAPDFQGDILFQFTPSYDYLYPCNVQQTHGLAIVCTDPEARCDAEGPA